MGCGTRHPLQRSSIAHPKEHQEKYTPSQYCGLARTHKRNRAKQFIITIKGDNPATIEVGDTYADLGATITGPEGDLNLGIHLFVDDAATDTVQSDTSLTGNHMIMVRDPETAESRGQPMNPLGVRALSTPTRLG